MVKRTQRKRSTKCCTARTKKAMAGGFLRNKSLRSKMENANRPLEEFVQDLVNNIGLDEYSYIGGKNKNNVINPLPITLPNLNPNPKICNIYKNKNQGLGNEHKIPLNQIGVYVIYKPNTNTLTAKYVISLNDYCNNKYIQINKPKLPNPINGNSIFLIDDNVSLNRNSLKRSNEGSRRESKVINKSIKFLYVIGLNSPKSGMSQGSKPSTHQSGPNYIPEERVRLAAQEEARRQEENSRRANELRRTPTFVTSSNPFGPSGAF